MSEHKYIWLQPECCADPDEGRHWCQDPDPVDCDDGKPWVKYVLASEAEQQLLAVLGARDLALRTVDRFADTITSLQTELTTLKASLQQAQGEVAAVNAALGLYQAAMDRIYNHNEAARAAVVQHFGTLHLHPTPSDKQEAGGVERDYDDEPESPYCECDLQYDEEEQAFNKCGCCGKPII